jgi:hypothetical protein
MNISTVTLKSLVKLTENRDKLVKELEKIESEFASFFSGKPAKAKAKRAGRPKKKASSAKKVAKVSKKSRAKRGGLKEKILAALGSAGDAGVKVVDLAKTLGVKGTNIHVWFATTGKNNKTIKKIGKGHYKLVGK